MILRAGLLDGVGVRVDGAPEVAERLRALGAADGDDVLVYAGAAAPLEALDGAWEAIGAAGETLRERSGRIVLLAPAPGDAHAEAARGGLENLARTLSIEWSRFGVRVTAILPGAATPPEHVAELVAFLASPAGEYYSGCAFSLS